MNTKFNPQEYASLGYRVMPSDNGGFVVYLNELSVDWGKIPARYSSFSTAADLVNFLQSAHGIEEKAR